MLAGVFKLARGVALVAAAAMALGAPAGFAHKLTGYGANHTHKLPPGVLPRSDVETSRTIVGERYVPTIWVDPDGCQHWVMDDGWEGYMTPNVTRDGIPVCNRTPACKTLSSDQLFKTDKWSINASNRARLQQFFRTAGASAYIIEGHTDSRASDAYNIRLSQKRANAVAQIAASVGARISAVRAYGERMPIASNKSRKGMARNRRVEIYCVR